MSAPRRLMVAHARLRRAHLVPARAHCHRLHHAWQHTLLTYDTAAHQTTGLQRRALRGYRGRKLVGVGPEMLPRSLGDHDNQELGLLSGGAGRLPARRASSMRVTASPPQCGQSAPSNSTSRPQPAHHSGSRSSASGLSRISPGASGRRTRRRTPGLLPIRLIRLIDPVSTDYPAWVSQALCVRAASPSLRTRACRTAT
jgi:hypothetical protein